MKRILIVSLLICTLMLSAISSIPVLGAEVSVKTLEDIIKAVESADESNFTPEAWTALQENYDLAKRLLGDQQYFTIRADVPDEAAVLWDSGWPSGHNNYNKYLSILKDSTQAYLAYKGHGNNDYEKSDFSTDQLWEKVMVDEDKGVFMLRNVEYDAYLCGHRQDGSWGESPHQYFYLMKLSDIQDMSRARFYVNEDSILQIEYTSPSGAVYVDMYHSNDTLQSGGIQGLFTFPTLALKDPRASTPKCVFEEVDLSTAQLDTEKETQKAVENTRSLLQLNLTGFLSSLYKEYQNALGDLPRHYANSSDYEKLQNNLKMAESLMNGKLAQILHEKSSSVMTPTTDGKICLSAQKSGNLAQVWYCLSQGKDNFRFLNASTGGFLYHSNEQLDAYVNLVDYGYYLKVGNIYEENADVFYFGTKNNLLPKLSRSQSVNAVTVAFMEADNLAFTTAGIVENRAVRLSIADISVLKNQASSLLTTIRKIRKNRMDSMDYTLKQLKDMLSEVDKMNSSLYTETTWSLLTEAYQSAKTTANSKKPTVAQINLAVYGLELAVADLKKSDDIIPAGDAAYAAATAEIQPLYTIFSNKNYVKATSDRAKEALNAALTAAANGTKGVSLVTFGQLEQLCLNARHAYDCLVETLHYNSLVSAVTAVTNRLSSPEDYQVVLTEERYQPDTWKAFQSAFAQADETLRAFDANVWETPSSDVKTFAANLDSAIATLSDKPDYTALSSVLGMLDAMTMDSSVFTEDSWSAYETVYRVAKELIGDEYAGQVAVDALTNELIVAANTLKIDGVKGEVSLLPGLKVKVNSDVVDRYDDGYDNGYLEGSSLQYVTGYTDGGLSAQNDFYAAQKKTAIKPEEMPEPVEEVTSIINKNSKKNTVLEDDIRIFLPVWLILTLVGSGIAVMILGFFGGLLITKAILRRKQAKAATV